MLKFFASHYQKFIGVIRIFILVAWILTIGLLPESEPYLDMIARGHALREAKEYQAAITAYQAAHALRPRAITPQVWKIRTELLLGRPQNALPLRCQIPTMGETSSEVLIEWGKAYDALGDDKNASYLWQQALQLGKIEAHYHLGMAALRRGEWANAVSSLEASLSEISGRHTQEAFYWLGILHAIEDLDAAQEYLRKAAAGPDTLLANNAQILNRTLAQTPQGEQNRATVLGAALFGFGHWQAAEMYLEQAITNDPDDTQALTYLGATQAQQRQGELAYETLEKALRLDPDNLLALYFKGKLLLQQGKAIPARDIFVQILTSDPQNAAACAEIGKTYAAEGKYELAEQWFEAAIEQAPDPVDFYLILAEFEGDTLFDLERGIEAVESAIAFDPENPLAYDLLGRLLYLSGEWRASEMALNKALELEPDLTSAYYHLGKLYESQRRFVLARWAFGRVVDLGAGTYPQILAEETLRVLEKEK